MDKKALTLTADEIVSDLIARANLLRDSANSGRHGEQEKNALLLAERERVLRVAILDYLDARTMQVTLIET